MEVQLRILAVAAELESFTAESLAEASGCRVSTVRSVLQRRAEDFNEITPSQDAPTRGRPPKWYEPRDRDELRTHVANTSRALEDATAFARPVAPTMNSAERHEALLTVAADAINRMRAEPNDATALARLAERSAGGVFSDTHDPQLRLRAAWLATVAAVRSGLAAPSKAVRGERLHAAASLAARLVAEEPVARSIVFAAIAGASYIDTPPPVGLLTGPNVAPSSVTGLHGANAEWASRAWPGVGEQVLWSPVWAEALIDSHLLSGLVVYVTDQQDGLVLKRNLTEVAGWPAARLVAVEQPAKFVELAETAAVSGVPIMMATGHIIDSLNAQLARGTVLSQTGGVDVEQHRSRAVGITMYEVELDLDRQITYAAGE